jgi:hypothetical protein
VAAALVFGVISMSRIFGKVWYYLMLWAWGTAALLLLAVGWTAVVALRGRVRPETRQRVSRAAVVTGLVVVGVSTVAFTAAAVDAPPPSATESSILGGLLPGTVAALERGDGAAVGRDGRYLVTWTDAYYFGSQGYGLVSELEREGFDARAEEHRHVPITDHRVFASPAEADATVYLVTGSYIEEARTLPDVVEVAYVEPRDAAERAEFDRLRADVIDALAAAGLDDIVPIVDRNLFGASIDERVDRATQRRMARMLELGQPAAVFVAPAGTSL